MRESGYGLYGGAEILRVAQLEHFELENVPEGVLTGLKNLYSQAYHNPHMYEDLLEDMQRKPEVFRLFVARSLDQEQEILGARVIESKQHPFIDYRGFAPVHGKRFCVAPNSRGMGIGKQLIDEGKRYCFEELGLSAIFGESNEVGALSLYGREGALYLRDSISKALKRNNPQQAQAIFSEFLTNPVLRTLRFPGGDGIQFVYCRDDETSEVFRSYGYAPLEELTQ